MMKKFILVSVGSIAMGVGAAMGFSAISKLKKEKEDIVEDENAKKTPLIMK